MRSNGRRRGRGRGLYLMRLLGFHRLDQRGACSSLFLGGGGRGGGVEAKRAREGWLVIVVGGVLLSLCSSLLSLDAFSFSQSPPIPVTSFQPSPLISLLLSSK